jgi:mono/diheme cytochrome c family protein
MTNRRAAWIALASAAIILTVVVRRLGADTATPPAVFRQYCFQCHGKTSPAARISLEQMIAQTSMGEHFGQWERVVVAIEQQQMPPKGMPQPSDADRAHAVSWIRSRLNEYVKAHDGDPGRVTMRRLTSAEYGYAIQDLTGLDLDVGIGSSSDSAGGEGFTNFGDVQFMQSANLERYLQAAKIVADHAVIGAGPIEFFSDPGTTGFELSAIARIQQIYTTHGFRTVSGEGGTPFGLDKYGKALYTAWRYRHRAALGQPNATLPELAAREGVSVRFAEHIWSVMNRTSLGYPSSEVVSRWRQLPAPDSQASAAAARAACEEIQKFLTTWPSWLFARGDVAAGGAGDESPLMFNDVSLKVETKHHFTFNRGGRGGGRMAATPGPAKFYLNVVPVNPHATGKPLIVWRNPTIAYRKGGGRRGPSDATPTTTVAADGGKGAPPAGPREPLRKLVDEDTAKKLGFGNALGGTMVGPEDFAAESSVAFEVPVPEGIFAVELQVDADLAGDHNHVFRITISDRADGAARGIPTRTLLGDPQSVGYRTFKAGVLEFAALLPPNSHGEAAPADKDPIPEPFDSAFNVPEHDEFDTRVKYVRDDQFVYRHMLDDTTRARLDNAWNDLYASFEYHDNYMQMIAAHFGVDLKGKSIGQLSNTDLETLPAEPRKYVSSLRADYDRAMAAQAAARPRHVADCLEFASRAWRRPLTAAEQQSLRGFYDKIIISERDHRKAIRSLLTRILVAPAFLYRVEQASSAADAKPLSGYEMASRLSFFIWSSIPDSELRRAAAAGELSTTEGIQRQTQRMLADPKARRLATEFFGQWLGFYQFDEHKGVDTGRFPEFTNEVRSAMYDEAVSFFEYIVRNDRPVREILSADYAFLNQPLAHHYGVVREIKSKDRVELVPGASAFHRGGVLRLGAVLTAFSAPLRTSPVKRGDWVLRRILGTVLPPPPADAGSIPADDKLFGGLSPRAKLEAHKRNAACANCHVRIDPLGFPLERYDSIGRWRDQYADGKPIEDFGELADNQRISGIDGLLKYLETQDEHVRRTLSRKLVGFALGRTVLASDLPLMDRMIAAGKDARFSTLVAEAVTSRQFRNRSGAVGNNVAAAVNSKKAGE